MTPPNLIFQKVTGFTVQNTLMELAKQSIDHPEPPHFRNPDVYVASLQRVGIRVKVVGWGEALANGIEFPIGHPPHD